MEKYLLIIPLYHMTPITVFRFIMYFYSFVQSEPEFYQLDELLIVVAINIYRHCDRL